MKIAYISVYRDHTGYGNSSEHFISTLHKMEDVEVVPVWVSLSGNPKDSVVSEIENTDLSNVDLIIQEITPNFFCKHPNIPTVGLFFWETTGMKNSGWVEKCNQMDEIWVCTPEQSKACSDSGVEQNKIREITHPFDPGLYPKQERVIEHPNLKDRYIFYTISDLSYRKNISNLLISYYSAFTKNEKVCLLIKGFLDGGTEVDAKQAMENAVNTVKKEMRINEETPPVVFIPNIVDRETLGAIHNTGDCFITMSRGEGWCLPMVEAAHYDNLVIGPYWNGPKKIMQKVDYSYPIKQLLEKQVVSMTSAPNNLYHHSETWFEPSTCEAKENMHKAYVNRSKENFYLGQGVVNMSPKVIGKELKPMLERFKNEPCISHS